MTSPGHRVSRRLSHIQLWIQSLDSVAGPVPLKFVSGVHSRRERRKRHGSVLAQRSVCNLLVVTGCCVERSDTRGAIDFSYLSPGLVAGLTQG